MSTYRKEWDCCDSVTETEGWEPDACPFCRAAPAVALPAAPATALEAMRQWDSMPDAKMPARSSLPAAPELPQLPEQQDERAKFCRLIDELVASWNPIGSNEAQRQRRIAARKSLEDAIFSREYGKACASAGSTAGRVYQRKVDEKIIAHHAASRAMPAPLFRNVDKVTRSSDQSLTLRFMSARACSEFERAALADPQPQPQQGTNDAD